MEVGVVTWSSGITNAMDLSIERVQKRALRVIAYPITLSYCELLVVFKIDSLRQRREQLVLKFAKSLLVSDGHRYLLAPQRNLSYL